MRKLGYLAVASLVYGACLYDVGDVRSGSAAGGVGGSNEAGDVSSEGWAGGGTGGEPPDVVESAVDVQSDVSDATSDVSDATSDVTDGASDATDALSDVLGDGSPGAWKSCKDIGGTGTCFGGNTVLYFGIGPCYSTNHCWVNDCSQKPGGLCKKSNCGWYCSPLLTDSEADDCTKWKTGQCKGNAAIKAHTTEGNNCLYKDCTALGLKCEKPDAGVADCT